LKLSSSGSSCCSTASDSSVRVVPKLGIPPPKVHLPPSIPKRAHSPIPPPRKTNVEIQRVLNERPKR
jgi:hypothetical protein